MVADWCCTLRTTSISLQPLYRRPRKPRFFVQLTSPRRWGDVTLRNSNRKLPSKQSLARKGDSFTHWACPRKVRYREIKWSIMTSFGLMYLTMPCDATTSGIDGADSGTPCRVEVRTVGKNGCTTPIRSPSTSGFCTQTARKCYHLIEALPRERKNLDSAGKSSD